MTPGATADSIITSTPFEPGLDVFGAHPFVGLGRLSIVAALLGHDLRYGGVIRSSQHQAETLSERLPGEARSDEGWAPDEVADPNQRAIPIPV